MTREAWLAERRSIIGGSDIAAICGLSPWSTGYEVYLDKTGQLPDRPPSTAMTMGTLLEDAISRGYSDQTGRALCRVPYRIDRHPDHPWMGASLDAWTPAQDMIVECKNVSAFAHDDWGEPGTDQVPEHYAIQVQWQMGVTGIPVADVAALIGGVDFRIYTVPRNEQVIQALITIGEDFWRRVQERRPPEPDFRHPSTARLLAGLYGVNELLSVTLPPEAAELVKAYEDHGEVVRAHQEGRDEAKAQLLYLMGEASVGHLADGRFLTRKTVTVKVHQRKESSFVKLSLQKGKVKT